MDELLTPVSTTYLRAIKNEEPLFSEVQPVTKVAEALKTSKIASADDALALLKSQPDYASLTAILRYLTTAEKPSSASLNIHVPSSKSAAIIHVLVSEIIPNYWTLLSEGSLSGDDTASPTHRSVDAECILEILRCVAGLNAVVAHVKALVQESKLTKKDGQRSDIDLHIGIFLDLLAAVLEGDGSIQKVWKLSTAGLADSTSKKMQSQGLISLLSSGKILSIAAEAYSIVRKGDSSWDPRWLVDGTEFSRWVGRNVATWALSEPEGAELQSCYDLFQRSLSLGYSGSLVTVLIDELLLTQNRPVSAFSNVCLHQPQPSKRVINILLEQLSRRFMNSLRLEDQKPHETVSAVAGIIDQVVQDDQTRKLHLINWCCSPSGAGIGDAVGIRRAVIAVLARDKETITAVLEKSLNQFGDQLYIKHTAILQQEAHCQVLLLSAGHVARLSPIKLTMLLRSGSYLTTISNRIASTHARARFLGMCVGEALSALQGPSVKTLDFHMEEMESEDPQWFKGLTQVTDSVGPIEPLLSEKAEAEVLSPSIQVTKSRAKKPLKKVHKQAVSQPPPKAIIEEIDSSDNDDDDDDERFTPMAKLSDEEDSDDDPTLVQRNKTKPPVYIRDLITFLRDSESYDKQKLGVQTAPVLIRRKANYGSEVSSHADELARLLVGLQDKFDIEDFQGLRLQGMIALVLAQPKSMAPWFARTFFEGDYSLSQRTSVLVTLGLSARELAGFDTSEYKSITDFPSKRLPEKIEQLYIEPPSGLDGQTSSSQLKALPPTALDNITQSLTSSFLGPLAAEAADAHSGPDALKLQTFSARYKSKSRAKPRIRAIPNTAAAILATYFFSPLTAHFQFALRSSKPVVLNPALLALYLQTLGIITNAAGPSTLSLPQLTSELWDLLLRVRVHVLGDVGALKGWFVAMSVLLEVNEDNMRGLCQEQGREVVETREWVSGVFERTRGDDGGEENEVKMLAAGVLIKLGEAIEKYQALLMGDMLGL